MASILPRPQWVNPHTAGFLSKHKGPNWVGDGWYPFQWRHISSMASETTCHYDDVIMTMLASQITSLTVVYSIVYSGVNQRKHQSSASLAFVREIHRGPVNFPHKWPVTRKMFPFDDVIMQLDSLCILTKKQTPTRHITGPLSGESTGCKWNPNQRANNVSLL